METTMDHALLQAFGFEQEEGLWFFRMVFEDDNVAALVVAELDGGVYVGHVPMAHDPVSTEGLRKIPNASLVYRSFDVRDMIALAQNELASSVTQVKGGPPDEGFADEDDTIFITMPFGSTYGDYVLADGASRKDAHPEILGGYDLHGAAYLTWRDDFCERLLASAPKP
jgi:hypothetical protein